MRIAIAIVALCVLIICLIAFIGKVGQENLNAHNNAMTHCQLQGHSEGECVIITRK